MINRLFEPGHVIERKTHKKNDIGGWKEEWTTHALVVGLIRPLSGQERLSADKHTLVATHKFYCSPIDIKEGDRLIKDDRVFDVVFVKDPMSMGHHLEVDLLEVGRGDYEVSE